MQMLEHFVFPQSICE